MSITEFTKMQARLDELGFVTKIERIQNKRFNCIVNFTIERTYKTRISCKRRIIKLYEQNKK
jgi:hypothetical protein